jgi:hypothetical protein
MRFGKQAKVAKAMTCIEFERQNEFIYFNSFAVRNSKQGQSITGLQSPKKKWYTLSTTYMWTHLAK